MPIMEIFGPTIQGEGMVVGRKTMFVRTGGAIILALGVTVHLHGMEKKKQEYFQREKYMMK